MRLTPNRRIILNMIATYGRSIYGLFLGLFSTRWVLAALGKSDYGLFGIVGSIILVIGFINGIFGGAVGRFYAHALGVACNLSNDDSTKLLERWFNAAMSIHILLPLILCVAGYPIGLYVIHNYLVIPLGRMSACEHVFLLSLLAAFINMVTIPYVSMYRARQLITELSIWGVVQSTLVFLGAFYLMYVDSDRLVAYAILMTFIPSAIAILQSLRARRHFPQCKIVASYMFDWTYMSKLVSFASFEFFSCGGAIVREQGTAFLINRHFGPTVNAAWSISAQVSGQTTALSSAMIGAITPELTTASGAGDYARVKSLVFSTCKFGTLLILLFAIPLILEIHEILHLWLIEPPEYTATICRCILIALMCHKLGWGHHMAVLADGRVAGMQLMVGFVSASSVLLVLWAICKGFGVAGIGGSFIICYVVLTLVRVFWARMLLRVSVVYWASRIVLPIVATTVISFLGGHVIVISFPSSFTRIIATSLVTFMTTCLSGFLLVCDSTERSYLLSACKRLYRR